MAPPVMKPRITQYSQYVTSAHGCRGELCPRGGKENSRPYFWFLHSYTVTGRRAALPVTQEGSDEAPLLGPGGTSQLFTALPGVWNAESARMRCVTMREWTMTQPACESLGQECLDGCSHCFPDSAVSPLGNVCVLGEVWQSVKPHETWNISRNCLPFPLHLSLSMKSLAVRDEAPCNTESKCLKCCH